MSEFRRAYDLLRGYVNREWDRIRSFDVEEAWRELNTPTHRQEEAPKEDQPTKDPEAEAMDRKAMASSILGVKPDASFAEIKKAFDKLEKRCNPANFPEGSEESKNAAKIQTRVNWAFRVLVEDKPEAEKRFQSLEID